jgi:hypothetical protein
MVHKRIQIGLFYQILQQNYRLLILIEPRREWMMT